MDVQKVVSGQSKTDVVNMSTEVELWNQGPKIHSQPKFEIDQMKIGDVRIFSCHHTKT